MRSTLVYDLPTRLFHWLFAGLFLTSFIIGKTIDDESLLFSYHMLSGLLLAGLVVWRILWGFLGSDHARFSGFTLNPVHLKDYLTGLLTGSKKRWSGHNPASSWAAIVMFALALGLAITGYLMSTGGAEAYEDIHEFLANSFIVVVIMHVAGVVLHSFRHQDSIALSMIDGKKEVTDAPTAITSSHPFAALILLVLVGYSAVFLFKNFDSQNRSLSLFGTTLQLGENENENEGRGSDGDVNENGFQKDSDGDDD